MTSSDAVAASGAGSSADSGALRTGVLGARHVVFFVIAAAAPLGFSVGAIPLAVGRGGVGTSGMFVVCGVILAIFAVGYVAMAGHIRRVGGLYLFVMEGLGKTLGVGTAFLAILAYAVASTGAVGAFAVFAQQSARDLVHWKTSWQWWAFGAVIAMAILGLLRVELNARVLGIVILCEVSILLVVAFATVIQSGKHGLSGSGFSAHDVFDSHPGAMLAITVSAFAGFEATVLFAEEVRDRTRTIRRATFGSIGVMVVLYTFVCWAVIQAFGDSGAVTAANADPVGFFFAAAHDFVGQWAVKVMEVLVMSSWFASILAFHNGTSRYVFALGRDGVLPRAFGHTQRRFGSPWVASLGHSVFTVVVVLVFALAHRDPYLDLYVLGSTPAVVGIPVMEFLAAVAIFSYFLKDRHDLPAWQVRLCPLVAGAALAVVSYLIIDQLSLFTGRTGATNVVLTVLVFAAVLGGCGRAAWLKFRRPDVYAQLGQNDPTN